MANNPVQIVLNDNDYLVAPEPGTGGPPTDFFAGQDDEFAKHRAKLATCIQRVSAQLSAAGVGGAGYIRVKLRERALAKSHRPVRALFKPEVFPSVGAAGLGEIYYFAEAGQLANLINVVSEAEPYTNWVEKDGKREARPTIARSEVGAVEEITIPDPMGKRRFDVESAVTWLADARTGGYYLLELFENPRIAERRVAYLSSLEPYQQTLSRSLEALLEDLGNGVLAWRLPEAGGETPIAFKLTSQSGPALLSTTRPPDLAVTRRHYDALYSIHRFAESLCLFASNYLTPVQLRQARLGRCRRAHLTSATLRWGS
jgi:hypothetical protein